MASISPLHAATYFYHTDHLGTLQVLTDQSQEVVWQGEQEPFGGNSPSTSVVEQNLRFPGQYFDKETELHYNYFRDYDPAIGRYIESDPIGLNGGLGTFNYALNSPAAFVDPFGLTVYRCSQPAIGWMPINHEWIKTDTIEAGMGPVGMLAMLKAKKPYTKRK